MRVLLEASSLVSFLPLKEATRTFTSVELTVNVGYEQFAKTLKVQESARFMAETSKVVSLP